MNRLWPSGNVLIFIENSDFEGTVLKTERRRCVIAGQIGLVTPVTNFVPSETASSPSPLYLTATVSKVCFK